MKQLLSAIACAALLIGCATEQETTIDPTTAGNMGASGSGSVSLPPDRVVVTNPPPPFVAPVTGSPTP
jgi:hypothetical protein